MGSGRPPAQRQQLGVHPVNPAQLSEPRHERAAPRGRKLAVVTVIQLARAPGTQLEGKLSVGKPHALRLLVRLRDLPLQLSGLPRMFPAASGKASPGVPDISKVETKQTNKEQQEMKCEQISHPDFSLQPDGELEESCAHLLFLCTSSLKLLHFSSGQRKLHLQTSCSNRPCSSPDDNGHQPHDGFVEAVKELPQGPSLLLHAADHQTEAHGEHYQPQRVHPIGRARDGNDFFKAQHLGDGPQGLRDILQDAGGVLRRRELSGCHACCEIAAVKDGSGEDSGAVLRLVLK